MTAAALITATFTVPERIGTDPLSVLWLLPLAAAIAVVYKATKVSKIKARAFAKESAVLFGSIVIFMAVTAVVLYAVAWLVTE
jgi:hypothetical protein